MPHLGSTRAPALATAILAVAALAAAANAATLNLNPSKDNSMFGDLTSNSNGAGDGIYAGRTNTGGLRRGVLAFNLGAIPPGSTINSVTLTLEVTQTVSGPHTVALHRATANWGEGTSAGGGSGGAATAGDATWIQRFFGSTNWTTPGGDFAGTASATQSVSGFGSYAWTGAGLASDVQSWVTTPAGNFGWVVIGNEATNLTTKKFGSKESASPPVLTVDYTPPAPGASNAGIALLALALAGAALAFARRRLTA